MKSHSLQSKKSILGIRGRAVLFEFAYEERLFRFLAAMVFVALGAYVFLVGVSILHVIERKEAVAKATALRSAVGELEREYFALSSSVVPERGAALGLSPVRATDYVHRPGAVALDAPRSRQ
ncbi:hypothetical protein COU20_03165 [Candidatus Kaiserbacteria bacterium CG10_big_fil_rev_8_21_14_0_10_59_10]|uniref:Uncharacterized protein n=1 Tax=Candidatus Kaiserbacteria bacterium CG10_big_fil_rev_8_21_14_0_10_59_10 TaxID=1974612 RepID=A0A2H0U7A0_9BACT|nr:MAG: hypothetical protein COU20_03165 [Candidatus Kaiserbacteria bacterium CG10_big_fil_rev_8_21_14_0_10_59_10]